MTTKILLLATRNPGKIREIKEIFKGVPFELRTLDDIGFKEEIQETGKSFAENAILKAKTIGEKTKMLVLTEDSGLEVDALAGKPGIYSARYTRGSDSDRINKVLIELKEVPKEKRTAKFRAVVAIYDQEKKKIQTFDGVSEGYIVEKPVGTNGFGYDPIFFNLDLGKTNGEATLEEKNRVSHRARAINKVKKFLYTEGV